MQGLHPALGRPSLIMMPQSRKTQLIIGLLGVALLSFAAAYVFKADHEADIRAVITAQIEAFKRNDGEAAFAIAAPEIQAKFGNARTFMNMVASSYPQVYRPHHVDFLDIAVTGGHVLQKVILVDHDGNDAMAIYALTMVDGDWRISGYIISKLPGESI